jgi:hypothetical protein
MASGLRKYEKVATAMSHSQLITSELDRIAAQGRGRLEVDTGKGQLESVVVAVDAIGCAFETFALLTDKLAGASMEQVKKISAALAARLTYLLEPISPIEADFESCTLQMRSMPPRKEEAGTVYYELLVKRGGSLSLQRYRATPGQLRSPIAAQVTREVFQRLADDFLAVVP